MRKGLRYGTLILVLLAVAAILLTGRSGDKAARPNTAEPPAQAAGPEAAVPAAGPEAAAPAAAPEAAASAAAPAPATPAALPRLVDLGSNTCIPCKKMAPILAELAAEQAGRLEVLVIDVREDAAAAAKYGIRLIPTQIFFDAAGKEVWRHEGFIDKSAILARWAELGVALPGAAPAAVPAG